MIVKPSNLFHNWNRYIEIATVFLFIHFQRCMIENILNDCTEFMSLFIPISSSFLWAYDGVYCLCLFVGN